jgi:hypothetical protein
MNNLTFEFNVDLQTLRNAVDSYSSCNIVLNHGDRLWFDVFVCFVIIRTIEVRSECGKLTRITSTQLQHEKSISLLCIGELEVG